MRIRVPPSLTDRWDAVVAAHKISKQAAVIALIEWVARQDALTRSMVFGQVPETDHAVLSRIVLERLSAPAAAPKGKPKK